MARDGWPVAPVIYEIYPRSFLDTTGTGTGDLAGIGAKMDHVAALGVDAIWIAPFFPSPLEDGGYDVADHCAVHPDLGDLGDFDRLVAAAHGRDLKVMIDQVLNHTSISHDWFGKSARREDGFDDWYVWRDPRPDGTPPNNWMSYFGRPAWNWDHRREQYYWHQFLACQPNLNLRHPGVQKAHEDQMRFWRARRSHEPREVRPNGSRTPELDYPCARGRACPLPPRVRMTARCSPPAGASCPCNEHMTV